MTKLTPPCYKSFDKFFASCFETTNEQVTAWKGSLPIPKHDPSKIFTFMTTILRSVGIFGLLSLMAAVETCCLSYLGVNFAYGWALLLANPVLAGVCGSLTVGAMICSYMAAQDFVARKELVKGMERLTKKFQIDFELILETSEKIAWETKEEKIEELHQEAVRALCVEVLRDYQRQSDKGWEIESFEKKIAELQMGTLK